MMTNELTRYINELVTRIKHKPVHLTTYFDTQTFINNARANTQQAAMERTLNLNFLQALIDNTTIGQISMDEKLIELLVPWQDFQQTVQQKLIQHTPGAKQIVPKINSYTEFFQTIVERNLALSRAKISQQANVAAPVTEQRRPTSLRFFQQQPQTQCGSKIAFFQKPTELNLAQQATRMPASFAHAETIAKAAIAGAINGLAAGTAQHCYSASSKLFQTIEGLCLGARFAPTEYSQFVSLISNVLRTKFSALELEFITPLQQDCLIRQLAQQLPNQLMIFKQTHLDPTIEVNAAIADGAKINFLKQHIQLGLTVADQCSKQVKIMPVTRLHSKELPIKSEQPRELYHSIYGYRVGAGINYQ